MFTKLSEKLTDVLIKKGISKNEDKEIIIYGLSFGIEIIFNIITTIALGIIFKLLIESFVFLISFSLIRIYSGGYHCQKAINCYFFSSGIVILVLTIVKFASKQYIMAICLVMITLSVPIILKIAPVESLNKPLDDFEKAHYRKKVILNLLLELVFIWIFFILQLYTITFILCLGIIVSACLIFLQVIIDLI